ncbi:MAG: response regulator [Anaerolineaceae bacterium]|jgi:DNA-binding NtrC family response regulator|nr:response regulator [Anaerolineaceae bacterium]
MKSILFVDNDPRITQRAERLLRPLNNRFRIVFLNNGLQAKKLLSRETFNIVITDIQSKGISGADLLRHIQRYSPQTVRIILSDQAKKDTIIRSVDFAHQFISKPFDYDSLTESIFNAVSLGGLIQDKKLRNLLLSIRSLPSFPLLHIEIVEELRGQNPSSDRVGETISRQR